MNEHTGEPGKNIPIIMPRKAAMLVLCVCLACTVVAAGCSEDTFLSLRETNQPPSIRLTSGPLEGVKTKYKVHFYWLGNDPDGTIDHYEYIVVSGNPIGFNPDDTTGLDKWTKTNVSNTVLEVSADTYDEEVTIDNRLYSVFSRTHTFFVRAVDDEGLPSEVAHRSFTAYTLAPHIYINYPLNPQNVTQYLPTTAIFRWTGRDPIEYPWNYQDVDSIRYMYMECESDCINDLNEHPEEFEDLWSPWISYTASSDSGTSTILGDDEIITPGHTYLFAVQAKDEAGAVTAIFDIRTNARTFIPRTVTGPLLVVSEPYLGQTLWIGTVCNPKIIDAMAGIPMNFNWYGDASQYNGSIATYRYGWDINDLDNPSEWDVTASPYITKAPERKFYSGVHTLYIEAVDHVGNVTLATIEINIVPLMDRDLLWVDDYLSADFTQIQYVTPTESGHDEFWINICSRALRFNPATDVYDTAEHNFKIPNVQLLCRYRNIIWTFCDTRRDLNVWAKIICFTPEENIGNSNAIYNYNILTYYMALGGHLWSVGKSDREGGLAATLPEIFNGWVYIKHLIFPLSVKCEMTTGPGHGCTDTSGAQSMPYRDYCVSILDKAYGVFREEPDMPQRDIEMDAMFYAYIDDNDPITNSHPELPQYLHLWREVTRRGRWFDPLVRGFNYIEVYDPKYWMSRNGLYSRPCFHPLYRMKSRSSYSCIDNAVVAFWTTKYANVVADAPGAVAAPSVHFGMPLWFFDRYEVTALAEEIFREWQIQLDEQ